MLNREAYANYFPSSFRAAVKLQGLSSLFFTNGRLVILQHTFAKARRQITSFYLG